MVKSTFNKIGRWFLYCVLLICFNRYGQAQSTSQVIISEKPWQTATWNGNEQPYKVARANIEQAASRKSLSAQKITDYRLTAEKNPSNPLTQFRWAYASYQATHSIPSVLQTVYPQLGDLERPTFPHSYEYSRVAFLIGSGAGNPHLREVGERLLQHQPKDFDVEYQLSKCIDPTLSPQDKESDLTHARNLIKMRPNDRRSYGALGRIYYYLWSVSHNSSDGERAVKAYKQSLKLGVPNAAIAAIFQRSILEIQASKKGSFSP